MDENKISKNKKLVFLLVGILVLFIVAYSIYYIWYTKSDTYEIEQRLLGLEQLEKSSAPITATIDDRVNNLKNLEKSSKAVTESTADRLQGLDALSGN